MINSVTANSFVKITDENCLQLPLEINKAKGL